MARTKNINDGAIPSGNSVQALNLLRLSLLVGTRDYRAKAESIFRAFAALVARSPLQFERLLCAVDFYYVQPMEIAIVAGPGGSSNHALPPVIESDVNHGLVMSRGRQLPVHQSRSCSPELAIATSPVSKSMASTS